MHSSKNRLSHSAMNCQKNRAWTYDSIISFSTEQKACTLIQLLLLFVALNCHDFHLQDYISLADTSGLTIFFLLIYMTLKFRMKLSSSYVKWTSS